MPPTIPVPDESLFASAIGQAQAQSAAQNPFLQLAPEIGQIQLDPRESHGADMGRLLLKSVLGNALAGAGQSYQAQRNTDITNAALAAQHNALYGGDISNPGLSNSVFAPIQNAASIFSADRGIKNDIFRAQLGYELGMKRQENEMQQARELALKGQRMNPNTGAIEQIPGAADALAATAQAEAAAKAKGEHLGTLGAITGLDSPGLAPSADNPKIASPTLQRMAKHYTLAGGNTEKAGEAVKQENEWISKRQTEDIGTQNMLGQYDSAVSQAGDTGPGTSIGNLYYNITGNDPTKVAARDQLKQIQIQMMKSMVSGGGDSSGGSSGGMGGIKNQNEYQSIMDAYPAPESTSAPALRAYGDILHRTADLHAAETGFLKTAIKNHGMTRDEAIDAFNQVAQAAPAAQKQKDGSMKFTPLRKDPIAMWGFYNFQQIPEKQRQEIYGSWQKQNPNSKAIDFFKEMGN